MIKKVTRRKKFYKNKNFLFVIFTKTYLKEKLFSKYTMLYFKIYYKLSEYLFAKLARS